jgi:hypothetical protein
MRQKAETSAATELTETIIYFTNNIDRMNYVRYTKLNFSIGSGVTQGKRIKSCSNEKCNVIVHQTKPTPHMKLNSDLNKVATLALFCRMLYHTIFIN